MNEGSPGGRQLYFYGLASAQVSYSIRLTDLVYNQFIIVDISCGR